MYFWSGQWCFDISDPVYKKGKYDNKIAEWLPLMKRILKSGSILLVHLITYCQRNSRSRLENYLTDTI